MMGLMGFIIVSVIRKLPPQAAVLNKTPDITMDQRVEKGIRARAKDPAEAAELIEQYRAKRRSPASR